MVYVIKKNQMEDDMGKKERIYELASGYFTEEVNHVVDEVEIQDEFREGSTCSRLYEKITELEKKLCEKLQADEVRDLERIIDCMEDITKKIAMRMYDYGALIGTDEI